MALEIDDLRKRYGRSEVCGGISVELGDEIVGVLGPNGAGKTTLLSIVAGDQRADAGWVVVDGHDLSTARGRSGARGVVGYLPQRFDLVGSMRVEAFVRYAGWCHGLDRTSLDDSARQALGRVDLWSRRRDRVRQLSGGQRQRLGLAACVVHRPRLLVLDEPTVGLDPEQRASFRHTLRTLESPSTILIATHLVEDLRHLADRVLVVLDGRIVFDGTPLTLGRRGGAAGRDDDVDLERGYTDVLARARGDAPT